VIRVTNPVLVPGEGYLTMPEDDSERLQVEFPRTNRPLM
jgi:hypothetical protein